MLSLFFCFFFFSSRRRHTRCSRDWSSDVCSSDLLAACRKRVLKHFGRPLEQSRGAALINRYLGAAELRIVHLLVITEIARRIDNGHGHVPVVFHRLGKRRCSSFFGIFKADWCAIGRWRLRVKHLRGGQQARERHSADGRFHCGLFRHGCSSSVWMAMAFSKGGKLDHGGSLLQFFLCATR